MNNKLNNKAIMLAIIPPIPNPFSLFDVAPIIDNTKATIASTNPNYGINIQIIANIASANPTIPIINSLLDLFSIIFSFLN